VEDIEKIHNNMNDIFNADVRVVSAKEKTLPNYLYYLKAQILKDQGFGVKADLAKAYENPIIAELAKGGDLENSELKLSADEIEHQYDYIRTTFDDLGVSFVYQNPDYKLAVIKPAAEQSAEISENAGLKASTSPFETLNSEDKTSIAQILAAQSFYPVQTEAPVKLEPQPEAVKEETIAAEQTINTNDSSEVEEAKAQADIEQVVAENTESISVEQKIQDLETEVSKEPESMKFVAEEVKETPDFKITYENNEPAVSGLKDDPAVEVQNTNSSDENIETDAAEPVKVVEKHADVNLDEFNIIPQKTLEVKDDDEVVALDTSVDEEKLEEPEQQPEQKAEEIIKEVVPEKTVDVNVTKDEMVVKSEIADEIENVEIAEADLIQEQEIVTEVEVEDNTIIESAKTEAIENILDTDDVVQETKKAKKKRKAKKEMDLKEFLAPSAQDVSRPEKNVKEKKEPELKDFLNETTPEVSAVSQEDKPKKVKKSHKKEKEEILDDVVEPEIPAFVEEIKSEKEKHVWFWQKKQSEVSEFENVQEETPINDLLETPEETNLDNDSNPGVNKPKKSWFGFLKRKKKVNDTPSVFPEEVENFTPEEIEKEANLDEIPYIRLDKEEIENPEIQASETPKIKNHKNKEKHSKTQSETKVNTKQITKITEPIEVLPSGKKVIKQMNH
ncbi:MAG: hypothetical protein K2F57_02565, partial [Candidatus Gastranaerophilales bacterium]|nr:hypothetical protein [Candidatus Gastranaerophilales bacterium]